MKTIAIAGCGKLGSIVARAAASGLLPGYKVTGVFSRTAAKAEAVANELRAAGQDCRVAQSIEELLALNPDFLVEAASPAALREWALPALAQGTSVVCLSIGAFADEAFYADAQRTAAQGGSRIYIVSGATGGFDVLQTATLMGGAEAEFFNEKGPRRAARHSRLRRCPTGRTAHGVLRHGGRGHKALPHQGKRYGGSRPRLGRPGKAEREDAVNAGLQGRHPAR